MHIRCAHCHGIPIKHYDNFCGVNFAFIEINSTYMYCCVSPTYNRAYTTFMHAVQ